MPLQLEETQAIQEAAALFTFINAVNAHPLAQSQAAGKFVTAGNKVDPKLAQEVYADMYSLAVDQDLMTLAMIEEQCARIQAGICDLLARAEAI